MGHHSDSSHLIKSRTINPDRKRSGKLYFRASTDVGEWPPEKKSVPTLMLTLFPDELGLNWD